MKKTLALVSVLILAGCTHYHGATIKQTIVTKDGISHTNEVSTMNVTSVFDGSNKLHDASVKQSSKSQGIGVGSLEQESSGSNTVQALQAIGTILQTLPK